ncbi:Uromodulin [Stylophora pistillata]|uniref:Uromodulin n=1 Tax=Stylophora pistillata TaxID=50429 RepID=A0A2B4SJM7_STYPI|nr:Uromodulin [Stylophora pistillata]
MVYALLVLPDIDECSDEYQGCDVNANCTNTDGSHNCTCKEGYIGDGQSCQVDTCFHYKHLNETNRKNNYKTPLKFVLCDKQLQEGWYRFVGAAGTKMPTTRVPAFRCGTNWSGWLNGAHPTVEDGMVAKEVCFSDRDTGCKYWTTIHVKNCEFYFIYKLRSTACHSRYCGTD